MSRVRGADPGQLRSLAGTLDAEANAIERARGSATGRLGQTWWRGPDAERFAREWQSRHSRQLGQTVNMLRQAAGELRRQAALQESISRG